MNYLVDTHLLLWASVGQTKNFKSNSGLSKAAAEIISDANNELFFSSAAIWEVAIKAAVGKADFNVDAGVLRRELMDNGYKELSITGEHAAAVVGLETHHTDPFDRIQIAQATVEGMPLLTQDAKIGLYTKNPIKLV
ncbi:type II toxin-antitoxin system VapC family toxin [Xanthomonas citri]|uniref:type II toxin-antitoxin system VapC family toxin n=1 Tax=Xanthomonas citri TaxID=346 RepID=UPI000C1FC2B1|nr:type II toxin-antitoxin system VapC family toxin [Xanthomonas citri]